MGSLSKLILMELKLFMREPITLIFTLIMPLMMFLVMCEVFGSEGASSAFRNVDAINYYAPAYVGVVIAGVGIIAIPVHLAAYRERGILRRMQASSMSFKELFTSQMVVGFMISLVCIAILLIPAVLLYDVTAPDSAVFVVLGSLLSVLCFISIGICLGFLLPSARAAQAVGMPMFLLMYVISGAAPPRDKMSSVMQNIGKCLPLWHGTTVVQDAWLGYGWNLKASLILAAFLVASAVITFVKIRRE